MKTITRHILTIPGTERRVHYRRCGNGPALIMVHQSPRSSAEYEALMRKWSEHFTCIAPDTPGFGQSDPLPRKGEALPDINDFADALIGFVSALNLPQPPLAYGFHSGAVILMTAIKRHPQAFSALAMGGYAVWNEEEMRIFGERYLPAFHPSDYGEHLTWLWHRIMEQSWVFPWFDTREEARLPNAHDDPERAQEWVVDLLNAGDAYRAGYGAVLHAPRDIPPVDSVMPPCLITAYDGDPLQPHIDRLGDMPEGWHAEKVRTPDEHQAASLSLLKQHADGNETPELPEDENEGWTDVDGCLIHWKGERGNRLIVHGPATEMIEPADGELSIDVPGHGQSDPCEDMRGTIEKAAAQLDATEISWPNVPLGSVETLYPDMTPDRFGAHLQRAWGVARAEAFFEPWNGASAANAIPLDPQKLEPEALHSRAVARLRAGHSARHWHETLVSIHNEMK